MRFRDFDAQAFLREYWQKKPLLIRNPWTEWRNPLEPNELAGLACEAHVESRLISEAADEWALEHGPVAEDRFNELGKAPWTLLVQAVDHYVPEVAELLDPFRFIPNWRIDDVMVSYATDGGGVGAHFDQYDVFLIQGLGRRRWELGGLCNDDTPLLPHDGLRLLAEFEPEQEWVLEPGDILYVPPQIAHRGVAVGHDCMTYSVGFRAPSRDELIAGWADTVTSGDNDDDRYTDPDLAMQANAGEISDDALARLRAMIAERLNDKEAFARWFGEFATAPKNDRIDWRLENPVTIDHVSAMFETEQVVLRNPASRFAYISEDGGEVLLMVDGECIPCGGTVAAFAKAICAGPRVEVTPDQVFADVSELTCDLINRGCLAFERGES
ncbi:cupin domain-containing protein [Erythrobacter rubeus]|uniref:Cupin domain-containing protein n=1 Tax=Erythrobacter rubeus TaxID=2760803 RepID=A0ABR8KRK8_9SPHN|nr:cupin domain-containing protein [Erythrobacter rubeus]MBD2840821.1 cupin domain-containing protein [Erythrobacter rubeus]